MRSLPRSPLSRHSLVVVAFAASLLAVVVTPWCSRDRVADPAQWVAAVTPMVRQGDTVLVHPPWRDDVARALRSSGALQPGATATVAFAPRHGEPLPALHLLVVTDGSAPLPRALRNAIGTSEERDGITMMRLRQDPQASASGRSLLERLAEAHVELRGPGDDVIACPWDPTRARHVCEGQPEWQHVGMAELPIGGKNVSCAWAHPKTGAVLSIAFTGVRVLAELELSLALTDGAAGNTSAAPVDAALFVDGKEAAHLTKRPGRRGFERAAVRVEGPRDADVELRITTPDDGQRHACFLLDTRGSGR